MDDDKSVKLPPRGNNGWPGQGNSQGANGGANSRAPFADEVERMPTMPFPPVRKVKRSWPLFVRVMIIVLLLLVLAGAFSLVYCYYYVQSSVSTFIHPVSRGQDEPGNDVIPSDSNVTGQSWNILLLGSDNDGKYNFPALLTQVMMVVHVDTNNNAVTLLSIPRDSWVYVPEVGGMHKIDQAFFLGATQHNSFDDGVRLARLTIEKDYGITIDRYAWVGLSGFASVIDTLGGVDIDVTHPVVDDTYPDDTGAHPNDPFAYKRLYIAPGPQHMNGLQALEYVRSRHADLVGDIGRTNRQQEILAALKKKVTVPNIINHFQQLISDMAGKVYTDMSPEEILAFANFGRTLPSSGIQHITLGPGSGNQNYGQLAQVNDPSINADQDVVLPQCANIGPLFASIFGGFVNCNVTGGF